MELPFPLLLSAHPETIMGERNVQLFGDYFPIRFDYLDTIDGDHLSLQVHPQQAYIEQTFNETMTQQESYYIMEQKEGAKPFVGLGFTEGTTGEELLQAVESAHTLGKPLKIPEFVNFWNANKGDLFLIPPGAVHFRAKTIWCWRSLRQPGGLPSKYTTICGWTETGGRVRSTVIMPEPTCRSSLTRITFRSI